MKLQLQTDAARNQITGHGDGYVAVNGVRREGSVLVSADSLVAWPPRSAGELTVDHLAPLLALTPEIVLLGTGARQQFPGHWLARACAAAAAGLEVMDTPAPAGPTTCCWPRAGGWWQRCWWRSRRADAPPQEPAQHLQVRGDAAAERMQLVAAFEHGHDAPLRVLGRHGDQRLRDPRVIGLDRRRR